MSAGVLRFHLFGLYAVYRVRESNLMIIMLADVLVPGAPFTNMA